MTKRVFWFAAVVLISLLTAIHGSAQEDKVAQTAIETLKAQMRLPKDVEVKFVEKKESPIPDYYSVKLLLITSDRDIPMVVYVDKTGEKVIVGNLIVKGENVTQKEAGPPKPRKIDMGQLDLEKSPQRGAQNARVTIVEFSNFQCPYCLQSWKKIKGFLEKHPKEIKYVFKHFPLQSQGKPFEISEMIAATQDLGSEAFWPVHDFFFTDEGQQVLKGENAAVKKKIEEILIEKGFDVKSFQKALDTGRGKKRVQADLATGNKMKVRGTPTTLLNGEFVRNPLSDKLVNDYLKK